MNNLIKKLFFKIMGNLKINSKSKIIKIIKMQ